MKTLNFGNGSAPQATVVAASGVSSDPVAIPTGVRSITVGLVPAGGATGKVQYTLSSKEAVEGNTATWRDWPLGVVNAVSDDVINGPVTAVRAVSTTGNITLEVVGG